MKESLLAFCFILATYMVNTYYYLDFPYKLFVAYVCMMPYFVFVCNEDIEQKYRYYIIKK